jgi:hypothetical protein
MQTSETRYDGTSPPKNAALIFGNAGQLAALQRFAGPMGCIVTDGFDLANGADRNDAGADFDLLLINLRSETDRPVEQMVNVMAYLKEGNADVIVWTDLDGLDEAYAGLPISRCHFLVDTNEAEEMLIFAKVIMRVKMERLHSDNRQIEFSALHRISDELADFAKTLARIAEQDEDNRGAGFAERPVSFRPAPTAIMQPIAIAADKPAEQISASYIRELIKLRRSRDRYFDAELFADPGWDILLDLFAAKFEGATVSVSSLCIAAAVPATTALRWISAMTVNGILVRRHDPKDARRVFIELSKGTAAQMTAYFAETQLRGHQPAHQPV